MPTLHDSIQSLAQIFSSHVLEAIRGASLEDILAESSAGGRGIGRSPAKRTPARRTIKAAFVQPAAASGLVRRAGGRGPGRPPGPTSKRLARRSADDIASVADSIVSLVKKHHGGLRAEQIRAELGIAKNAWMRPLELALSSKKLTKKGEKRATTYFSK
jgi:hypothetical protein